MSANSSAKLTLVTPNRLDSSTRESLRFALRNPNLTLLQLGKERGGSNPLRLMLGRFDRQIVRVGLSAMEELSSVYWLEREDVIDVSTLKKILSWVAEHGECDTPKGLMLVRDLAVDGEMWREQLVPRVWNSAAHKRLTSGADWFDIEWQIEGSCRIRTDLKSEQIAAELPAQSFETDDDYVEHVIFYLLIGEYETVLQLTDYSEETQMRPATWCSIQIARADALRSLGRVEEGAALSLDVTRAYSDYPHAWFVYGCCALELGKFVGATGAFNRAIKASTILSHELYHEPSVWDWQALLGTLFARLGLGDTQGIKARMGKVFEDVPDALANRLTIELTSALLDQNEVLLAWEIIEPRLAKDAVSVVPVVLDIARYYIRQEGQRPALNWLTGLSSNFGTLLSDYQFCIALYELAVDVEDKKTAHELLWILVEFDEAPEAIFTALANDLLSRGRLDEAERLEQKRQNLFKDD